MKKFGAFLFILTLIAIVANAQRSEVAEERRHEDDDCRRGEMLWGDTCTPTCTTDTDCPGTRCRVLGLMADDQPTQYADDIRDELLERQALMEEAKREPILVEPPRCEREAGDDCSERREPMVIEPTMPVMACETVAIQEQRIASEEVRE